MLKLGMLGQLLSFVLVLLFVPSQSRHLLLNTQPADWYGELTLPSRGQLAIIAKNSGGKPVKLELEGVRRELVKGFDSAAAFEMKELTSVPAESVALILVDNDNVAAPDQARQVVGETGLPFAPGPLGMATRSDSVASFGLVLIVVSCFVFLSYSVGIYICDRSPAFADKE